MSLENHEVENHEKARFLLHRSLVEGISPEDQHWLDAHVEQCAECRRHADLSARAVRALDWFALELDPAAVLRVENVVRSRAERMRSAEAHAKSLWIGTAIAIFLTFAGSAVAWRPMAWLASQWNLPSRVWQIVFAAFWLLPSLLLAFLPLFRRRLLGEDSDGNGQTV
jgi:predicted anti-sigma-YlaC factor YlaD